MLIRWILPGLIVWGAVAAGPLQVVVVEGDGAINNINLRRARDPVIRVETDSGSPVSGATVHFVVPTQGPGGTFLDGGSTLTTMSGADGRAVARGLRPNKTPGQFEIRVTASYEGSTASARILQTNAQPAEVKGHSSKAIAILAIVGGAAAGGAVLAARAGKNAESAVSPVASSAAVGTVITPGSPRFGAP